MKLVLGSDPTPSLWDQIRTLSNPLLDLQICTAERRLWWLAASEVGGKT